MSNNKLNWKALSAAFSLTWASFIVMVGLSAAFWGWGVGAVEALSKIYIGYAPTIAGTLVGIPWALMDGAIAGAFIGLIYNYFQDRL